MNTVVDRTSEFRRRRIRFLLVIFIAGLTFSGITAFPIEGELAIAHRAVARYFPDTQLDGWIHLAYDGMRETNSKYPFISYGTEWLAFAHLVIAIAFIGPLKDPVKNIWIIEFGIIACIAVFPLALIAGKARSIPLYWRIVDCSFGMAGGILLSICYRDVRRLKNVKIVKS